MTTVTGKAGGLFRSSSQDPSWWAAAAVVGSEAYDIIKLDRDDDESARLTYEQT